LENVRNKVNLIVFVPTFFPLESDSLQANIMYSATPIKRARSSSYAGKQSEKSKSKAKVEDDA